MARQAAGQLDTVERATVYDAIALDYLAGWYEAGTGLENSTLLGPIEGEESDYVMINHARWDHSLPLFMGGQLPKRTFRSYMLANLRGHHLSATPVLYRLA